MSALNILLSKYIDSVLDNQTISLLGDHLFKAGLIRPSAHLGGSDEKTALKNDVNKANLTEFAVKSVLSQTSVSLSEIYQDKKSRSKQIFILCMIAIAACIILLLTGIVIVFIQENSSRLALITSMSSLVPAFMSATTFFLYKKTNDALANIEQEVIKLQKLETFLNLIDHITDIAAKQVAYANIAAQMK